MTAIKQIRRTPSMPPWARWRATDPNGSRWVYSRKPMVTTQDQEPLFIEPLWFCAAGDNCEIYPSTKPNDRTWRQSLRRIVSARGGK